MPNLMVAWRPCCAVRATRRCSRRTAHQNSSVKLIDMHSNTPWKMTAASDASALSARR
jgi:hypothetical protein